jgi:hypothetical protein
MADAHGKQTISNDRPEKPFRYSWLMPPGHRRCRRIFSPDSSAAAASDIFADYFRITLFILRQFSLILLYADDIFFFAISLFSAMIVFRPVHY